MSCFRRKKKHDPNTFREISLNEYSEEDITVKDARKEIESTRDAEKKKLTYPRNVTKTSRYNIINFLFIALFMHFSKLTNLYFLIMTALLVTPAISPFNPGSIITPIVFITLVSLIREAAEDISRHNSDR